MNEGMNAVCFGWGTARGRAAEGAETVRESAASKRPAAGRNHDETTVSLCVKSIPIRSVNSQMKEVQTGAFIRVATMGRDGHLNTEKEKWKV